MRSLRTKVTAVKFKPEGHNLLVLEPQRKLTAARKTARGREKGKEHPASPILQSTPLANPVGSYNGSLEKAACGSQTTCHTEQNREKAKYELMPKQTQD